MMVRGVVAVASSPLRPSCFSRRPHQRAPLRLRSTRWRRSAADMNGELWALDFDGVICDSCGESSLSAWKAAAKLWPETMNSQAALDKKDSIIEDMRAVRPVVETGYENIVQIRCLLEGVGVDEMLEDWGSILEDYMKKWSLDRAELVELFGSTRDKWMAEDLTSWLAPNRIYQGLPDALKSAMEDEQKEVYIVTTKQARFTATLLRDMAGVEFPMERIFSMTVSGRPKTEVLAMLEEKHPDRRCFFIEDKISTLEKVCQQSEFDVWSLYLADWGYNTARERKRAEANPKITVFGLPDFNALLDGKKAEAV
ncbi:hypothetical protein BSKO_02228 [Bryopsis sp. KO-2023]|nr:hypothetical protein BSKO_02228 [Bryopsis sp. KO-2023]